MEDLALKYVNVIKWPVSKLVRFIVYQPNCHTIYLQVETTKKLSITSRPATKVDGYTKVEVGSSSNFQVSGLER